MRVTSQFHVYLIIQLPENNDDKTNEQACGPSGMSWMCLWFGDKRTVAFSSHCEKQKQGLKTSSSRSCPGGGARVQPGGPLNALVFRRFYHGSESGVFVCQQGSRAVKLQDLPGGRRTEWKRAEWRRAECLLASAQTCGFDCWNCRMWSRNEEMLCHQRILQPRLFAIGGLCNECKCLEHVSSYHLTWFLHLHDTTFWKRGLMISHSCAARR